MIIGDNPADRSANRSLVALEWEKSRDLPIRFEDGDFNIMTHRADRICKLRMEIWAREIRIHLLQSHPDANKVVAELLTGNKADFHRFRSANTHEQLCCRIARCHLFRCLMSKRDAVV